MGGSVVAKKKVTKKIQKANNRKSGEKKQEKDKKTAKKVKENKKLAMKKKTRPKLKKKGLKKKEQKLKEHIATLSKNKPKKELIKDINFILDKAQKEIDALKAENERLRLNLKSIELEINEERQKIEDLKKEILQKDAIIQLLEKENVEIHGLVQTEIDAAKVRWLGWPEGGVIEEVDLTLVNNSLEDVFDVHVDISLKDKKGSITRLEKLPVKKVLKSKEKARYKIHLFKYLRGRGPHYIIVNTYSTNPVCDFGSKEKTITI